MPTGPRDTLERFRTLEGRIAQVLESLEDARKARREAERDLAASRKELKELEREIQGLREERTLVRDRVESLIESISDLSEKQNVR